MAFFFFRTAEQLPCNQSLDKELRYEPSLAPPASSHVLRSRKAAPKAVLRASSFTPPSSTKPQDRLREWLFMGLITAGEPISGKAAACWRFGF